jgi:hypothetical protein
VGARSGKKLFGFVNNSPSNRNLTDTGRELPYYYPAKRLNEPGGDVPLDVEKRKPASLA